MTEIKVVHVRSPEWKEAIARGVAVYIGRNCPAFCGSPFGNPWRIGDMAVVDGNYRLIGRGEAILLYREWVRGDRQHPKGHKFPLHLLETLRGKVLGCWCAPEKCHGDVLVELLEEKTA